MICLHVIRGSVRSDKTSIKVIIKSIKTISHMTSESVANLLSGIVSQLIPLEVLLTTGH